VTQPVSLLPKTAQTATEPSTSAPFVGLLDVELPVTILLGTGRVTVKRCLSLQPNSILKLDQSAGEDLVIAVNGVRLARGEVMIVEDTTAVRITSIVKAAGKETSQS
jgi:flagellar motor switch protein FliN/FliY